MPSVLVCLQKRGKRKEERVKTLEPRSKKVPLLGDLGGWHVRTDELLGELGAFVVQENASTAKKLGVLRAFAAEKRAKSQEERIKTLEPRSKISKRLGELCGE